MEVKAAEDFTTASVRVLKKDVELGFTLLADILQHPAFHKPEFERIRSQILGEMASDNDDPGHVAMKSFNQLVFHGHPYRWPLYGSEESLSKITHADVVGFYNREYTPGQMILTIVGDVTTEQVTGLVQTHFGAWKKAATPPRNLKHPAPVEKKTVQLIEKDLTQSNVILGHGGISRNNPDFYAVTVMNYILGAGGFTSRLMDSIRDKQGLVYGIMSHFDARLMPGSFWINFQTRTEATNQAIQGCWPRSRTSAKRPSPIRSFRRRSPFWSEVSRCGSTPPPSSPRSWPRLSFTVWVRILFQYPKWIERVTKEDVLRVAKQYLNPQRYALVVVGNAARPS